MSPANHADLRPREPTGTRAINLMESLERLLERFDPHVFDVGRSRATIRIESGDAAADVILDGGAPRLAQADGRSPDAVLRADPHTWTSITEHTANGLAAFRARRLSIRRDLHLGVGFLAAVAPSTGPGRLRLRTARTRAGTISTIEAGTGDPVLLVHGLGATKASFLPTLGALAPHYRAIALDLPGHGDSDKPLLAPYNARFFADAVTALIDELEADRVHLIGNSMGGRVALEVGLRQPDRVNRLVLLAPSLAWLKARPWAAPLKFVPPVLGAIQPAPRPIVEAIVNAVVPGSQAEWTAAGIDEFLRSYLTPRGRAALYAAARNIYLEEPYGANGFWTRLPELRPEALFVWGRKDPLVPIGFARHVREALPASAHLELNGGHVPQLEKPRETHHAMLQFLAHGRLNS
jgi:pimeloyl-ACP methyl ester carboxylesterase